MVKKILVSPKWEQKTLGEVCEIKSGKNQSKVINPNGKYPIYGSSGIFGYADEYICDENTTIIGRKGTINSPIYVTTKFWNVDTAFGLCVKENLNSKFLYYFCLSFNFKKLDKSTTIPSLSKGDLLAIELPIPPLETQTFIVSKIEELFSELDKGIEDLKTAQLQLKTYRQSVLKWAFEGKLTNKKFKEGELPKSWDSVKIEFLLFDTKKGMSTGPFGTMLKKYEHQKDGIPVLGIENIGEGVFQLPNKIFITSEKAKELKNFVVIENDIIISRSGTVGEICLLPKKMENSIISTNLIRVRLNQKIINPKYFVYLFQGGKVRQEVFDLCKGSSRAFLNQTILKSLNFPYCEINEQNRVIQEIESRLSVADKMEENITQSLQQAEALRQSILKKAFSGELV
ncbi:restriction endonuclease subunit S [Flavobacterium sp. 120]|uniref:restriction endonuclease subunit S n=1 Tax=Flavobacterium sp. 120 TaxID=2135626 RepID=UPI000EB4D9CB|nr:restriction endonuclease subunit S [Flavobacterium sp. 120]RKS14324.1 type I restriction enzyme S subunit [Flavobacterium sp. 120]